jgi:spore germination protein KC
VTIKNFINHKIVLLLVFNCSLLLLTGCWDRQEPENLAIVLAGGYDYNPDTNMYKIILQVASPLVAAGGGQGGGGGTENPPYWTVSGWGYTPIDAVANIRKKVSREIHYSHLQLLILSEELVKTRGVVTVMDTLARSRQSRPVVIIAVARGNVEKMLSVNFPIETTNAQGLIDHITITSRELGTSINQTGRKFLNKLFQPGIEPVAIYLELINQKEAEKEDKPKPDSPPYIQHSGLAAFRNDKMVGVLNERETRGWSWLRDQGKEGIINITYPENEKTYLTLLALRNGYKIEPYFREDGSPAIKAQVKVAGNIISATGRVSFKEWTPITQSMENRFAEAIRNDIKLAIEKTQSLKSDIFGFGNAFYRKYYKEWLKMEENWPEIFAELPVEIDVRATIKRTGMVNEGIITR